MKTAIRPLLGFLSALGFLSSHRNSDTALDQGSRTNVKGPLLVLALIVVLVSGYAYWRYAEYYPSTDNAYVNADVVQIAAEVTGLVDEVFVENQQEVREGDALFVLDRRPFEIALAQATARLAQTKRAVAIDAAAVKAAQAEVENQRALLRGAENGARRSEELRRAGAGYISAQAYDEAQTALTSRMAQLALAEAKMRQAQITSGSAGNDNERVREAEAALDRAKLDLEHTRVAATCSGRVAGFSLRPGNVVRAYVPPLALVCRGRTWVDANFKETQLGRIRPGQRADVTVDMYKGHSFKGRVENIGGGSGLAFSLLPPQNASGNWVKVTQRVPVRIVILDNDAHFPLPIGVSTEVTIDTTRTQD